MIVNKDMVKVIQEKINNWTEDNKLVVDGDPGKNTMDFITRIAEIPNHWDKNRQLVGCIQVLCKKFPYELNPGPVDGYWGPQTEYAYEKMTTYNCGHTPAWRDDEGIGGAETGTWPLQTQDELTKYYGPVGSNQTKVNVPYPLKIAWKTETIITRFTCHEKVADSIARVLNRVLDHYGEEIPNLGLDLWGGALNVRAMRGGTKMSTHSWGMAIDWDPVRNKLRWGPDKANFAKPVYNKWFDLWEEEGAVSLGRARGYDFMHIQFARVN